MKKHFTYSLICILLSIVVYSCRKEVEPPDFKEVDPADLAQYAEKWLYKHSPVSKSGGGFVEGKQGVYYKPKWANILIDNNNKYQVAEFDITELGQAATLLPDTYDRFRECSDSIYLRSYTRYVYMIDKETGRDRGFLMTIVPELEYMEDTNFEPLDVNGYLKRDYRLSGLVLFYDIDGTFVNGWVYKNGKITATTQPISRELAEWRMQQREETKSGMMTCTEYYTVDYTETCWYSTPEMRPQDLIVCSTIYDPPRYWEQCAYDDGGGGGIAGIGGGGNGNIGGESGGPDTPMAKYIFKSSVLTSADWFELENLLVKLMEKCMGSNLYGQVSSKLSAYDKINIELNANLGVNEAGDYDHSTKTLRLANMDVLYHELFHVMQFFAEPNIQNNSLINIEIESYYADFLLKKQLYPGYQPAFFLEQQVSALGQYMDDKGQLQPDVSVVQFDGVLSSIADIFKANPIYKDFNFNPNRSGLDNFKNLKKITTGC